MEATVGKAPWASMKNDGCVGASVECVWDFGSNDDPIDELKFIGSHGSIKLAGMSPDGPIQVADANGKLQQELTFEKPDTKIWKVTKAYRC